MSLRCKNCGEEFDRGPHKCKTDMFGRPVNTPTNSNADEFEKTKAKVLYILKTHLTMEEDTDPDEVYASMIARHIHDNFELKAKVVEALNNKWQNSDKQSLEYRKGWNDGLDEAGRKLGLESE